MTELKRIDVDTPTPRGNHQNAKGAIADEAIAPAADEEECWLCEGTGVVSRVLPPRDWLTDGKCPECNGRSIIKPEEQQSALETRTPKTGAIADVAIAPSESSSLSFREFNRKLMALTEPRAPLPDPHEWAAVLAAWARYQPKMRGTDYEALYQDRIDQVESHIQQAEHRPKRARGYMHPTEGWTASGWPE